ncbi:hypothetical protein EON80_32685, partial [bacterium]
SRLLTVDWSHDQNWVAVCSVPGGQKLRTFDLESYPGWCDDFRVRGIREQTLFTYDIGSGRRLLARRIEAAEKDPDVPVSYAFSANGAYLVEGRNGALRWWSASTGRLLGRIVATQGAIGRTAISNDGKWLASEGDDPNWKLPDDDGPMSEAAYARALKLHVWNAANRKLKRTFPGYYNLNGGASMLAFSVTGETLYGACRGGGGLDRFHVATGKNSPLPADQKSGLTVAAVSDDRPWLAGMKSLQLPSNLGVGVELWSLATSKMRAHMGGTLRGNHGVKWSPSGKYLAGDGRLALWNAQTGKLLAEKADSYVEDLSWVDDSTIRTQTLGELQFWSVPEL